MTKSELLHMAKPILFNTEMVRAILDGRKTVTRRVMKVQPPKDVYPAKTFHKDGTWILRWWDINDLQYIKIPYSPRDVLYVRETWQYCYELDGNDQIIEDTGKYVYAASPEDVPKFTEWVREDGTHTDVMPWRPSIHMPKEAARIFLQVTDVRVERLQDITDKDAEKEGCSDYASTANGFCYIWDSTLKKSDLERYGWTANPWVWVIEFKRINPDV